MIAAWSGLAVACVSARVYVEWRVGCGGWWVVSRWSWLTAWCCLLCSHALWRIVAPSSYDQWSDVDAPQWRQDPWANRDELLHRCRGPRRNHLCQLLWLSFVGFERGGGQILGFSINWLVPSPLQHSRTTVRVVISPGDCTLQCGMWLWNHDSEFIMWQHLAMWYERWHVIEFPQTSAILEFYFWFRFRPYYRSRHVILHQLVCEILSKSATLGKKITSCRNDMADLRHLGF